MRSGKPYSDSSANETERAILTLAQAIEKQTKAIEGLCLSVASLLEAMIDQDEQGEPEAQPGPTIGLNGKPIN